MQLVQRLYDHRSEKTKTIRVVCFSIGLDYTAAVTAVEGEREWSLQLSG